jgi:hypothetical protein
VRYHERDYQRGGWGRGGAGYDLDFGNWGARSGLDSSRGRGYSGYDRPFRSGERSQWGFGAGVEPGYDRGFQSFRGYDRGFQRSPRYDREYGRDYGGGWGMTGLHQRMMRGRGEGFDYAGDYHHTHPIHPEELHRGYAPRGQRPWSGAPDRGRFGWRP